MNLRGERSHARKKFAWRKSSGVVAASFSTDGRELFTLRSDGDLTANSVGNGKIRSRRTLGTGSLGDAQVIAAAIRLETNSYVLGSDAGRLVVGSNDFIESYVSLLSAEAVRHVALAPRGEGVAASTDSDLLITDTSFSSMRLLDGAPGRVQFSADGATALSWTPSGHQSVWDVASGDIIARAELAEGLTYCHFSLVDESVLFADALGGVVRWDYRRGTFTVLFHGPANDPVSFLTVQPHGDYLAVVRRSGILAFWSLSDGLFIGQAMETSTHDGVLDFFWSQEQILIAYDCQQTAGGVEVWEVSLTGLSEEANWVSVVGAWIAESACMLVAGPDIPLARGVASRDETLRDAVRELRLSIGTRSTLEEALKQGSLDRVAPMLRSADFNVDKMVAATYGSGDTGPVYADLAHIPFAGVFSLCWDPSLLEAFSWRNPVEIAPSSARLLDSARDQHFTFTWLAGDPVRNGILIGARELHRYLNSTDTFRRVVSATATSAPLLFVGVRAMEIIDFLDNIIGADGLAFPPDDASRRFVAVCPRDDLWEFDRERLLVEYGVEAYGYAAGDGAELRSICSALHSSSAAAQDALRLNMFRSANRKRPRLGTVRLINIGPFVDLTLDLGPRWNVLLGDNGCGKSTVLRAIGLGLCGDHPSAAGAGAALLRAGSDKGTVELTIGTNLYRTNLLRTGSSVRVSSSSLTALQQVPWAVVGFPALRGMSVSTPAGISAPNSSVPSEDDLLPLVLGVVDQRLDDIKQWIVNQSLKFHARPRTEDNQLLTQFFDIIRILSPGGSISLESVDPDSWTVNVRTDDVVVPIEQLSQGMSSTISWVGTLLQRMYDIYPDSPYPADELALVLIDELDAHLHPEWQRQLPALLGLHFPNVQVIATSHSPLIASGVKPGELFVASRRFDTASDGSDTLITEIVKSDLDLKGLRADQVLATGLFGLATSRSTSFEADRERYLELFARTDLSPGDRAELDRLRNEMSTAYLDGETDQDRREKQARIAEIRELTKHAAISADPGRLNELLRLADGEMPAAGENVQRGERQ